MDQTPIYKLVNREWKTLPSMGSDVSIKDPKLKEGYLGDLSKKSAIELEEVLMRHDRILSKKLLISKLKDKGQSLWKRRQEVAEALEAARKREISEIADAPTDITAIEWTGTVMNGRVTTAKNDHLDSDDEEDEETLDPLRLMAYHSSCVKKPLHKDTRSEEEDPTEAIVQELRKLDIQDSVQQKKKTPHDFGTKREHMLDEKHRRNGPVKVSFKPFRRTNNPQPVPGLMHHASASTDHPVICISQQESLKLEHDFLTKDKERALKDTTEQLRTVKTEKIGLPPPSSLGKYRDKNLSKHLLDSDDEEEDTFYCAVDVDVFDDADEYFSDC